MVDKSERRWLLIFALLVMTATTIPYLVGFARQGADWRFTGFVFGIEDGNSYIARMMEGASGDWLIRLPNSGDPPHRFFALILYLLLGKLAAPPGQHEQLVALFQITRFAAGMLFLFATYDFLALFLESPPSRKFGTALVALGGGLGFLSLILPPGLWKGYLPLEFQTPESFGFYMIYGLPHLALARALVLWGLRGYLLNAEQPWNWKTGVKNGLFWLGAGLMQPISLVAGCAPIGAHVLLSGLRQAREKYSGRPVERAILVEYLRRAAWIALFAAPLVLYTFLAFRFDPYLRQWQDHDRFISPPFTDYLLAYGLALPLAVIGIPRLYKWNPWRGALVAGWLAVFPFLAYFPIGAQRRLTDGVWVAVAALALAGAESLRPAARRLAPFWLGFGFITTVMLVIGTLVPVTNPAHPQFRAAVEVQAYGFLSQNVPAGSIVMASRSVSNALPAWAPVRALTGHQIDTIDWDTLHGKIACFYAGCTDSERIVILRDFRVGYVFWGPEERALGGWDPRSAAFLKQLKVDGDYAIFEVSPGSASHE